MRKMKKSLTILTAIFALCMAFALTVKVDAAVAEVMDVPTSNFKVSYMTPDKTYVGIQVVYNGDWTQVGLFDVYGNLVASDVCASYATFNGLSRNKIYYYRARTVAYNYQTGTYDATSGWSGAKAFSTINYSLKAVKGKKAFTVKAPKVKGVKNYKVYMSKKRDTGFKKAKTIKAGKKIKITKYNKKAFKFYQYYYVKVVPQLSSGVKCTDFTLGRFYVNKIYR